MFPNPPPPPPPPHALPFTFSSPSNSIFRDPQESSLLLVTNLTEECHRLRQELIQQTKQIQEQQQYITELEEAIRELGDDYDGKVEGVEKLNRELEALERSILEKDKQHAKQLSQMNKTHNEDLESLLQEYSDLERENANLKALLMQAEDAINAKDSQLLDFKAQLRQYECSLKLQQQEELQQKETEPLFAEEDLGKEESDHGRYFLPLSAPQVMKEATLSIAETKEPNPADFFVIEGNQKIISSQQRAVKGKFSSLTGILKKHFSESDEDDDDLSPDKLTIRRDLSNKHHRAKSISSLSNNSSIDAFYPTKSVKFASAANLPSHSKDSLHSNASKDRSETASTDQPSTNGNLPWKDERKHMNVFEKIELQSDKSYFNWESGDSNPSSPDRSHSRTGAPSQEKKAKSSFSKSFRSKFLTSVSIPSSPKHRKDS